MEEGGTYLADQYAATPTSSLSGDDDDNRDMDSFLDNQVTTTRCWGDEVGNYGVFSFNAARRQPVVTGRRRFRRW